MLEIENTKGNSTRNITAPSIELYIAFSDDCIVVEIEYIHYTMSSAHVKLSLLNAIVTLIAVHESFKKYVLRQNSNRMHIVV